MNAMKEQMVGGDPLAHASEVPDVAALIEEFTQAQEHGMCTPGNIGAAEDVRFNRWKGKSSPPDGARWTKNAENGTVVRPYDGRPDTDVNLADEIVATEVDISLMASAMAHMGADTTHVTALTAAQAAELTAVARWAQKATRRERRRGEELLAQMTATLGWAVLNPGWCEKWGLVERELDLESFIGQTAQVFGAEAAQQLYVAILDESLEAQACQAVKQLFAHIPKERAKQIVRDLREEGAATFLDRQLMAKRPSLRVLIPGYNFFVSGGIEDLQAVRGALIVERFYQADLENIAASNGWNEEFVEAVIATAGTYSTYGHGLKIETSVQDAQDYGIEIWTTMVRQFDPETGAAGIYCTTFSPHLSPGASGTGPASGEGSAEERMYYAKHYLLDYAHGMYPFCQAEREVIGPSLDDSRGVPEMVQSDQKVIKNHQDALSIRAQLEVNPPRIKIGTGWSKMKDEWGPGAEMTANPGADMKYVGVDRGNPQVGEMVIQRIEKGTRRRFALPNNGEDGGHPSLWQMRQMRNSRRWLSCWEEAYWQLVVLCYQELDPYEIAKIIGRWPQLTVEVLLQHFVTLKFDPRGMDADWRKNTLDTMIQLLTIDKGGLVDTGKLIKIIGSYTDPTLMDEVIQNPAGAAAAIYRQVEQEVMSLMDGNPPQLSEGDATAEMQLKMAFQIVGQNQRYQYILQQSPVVQEHFKTWVQNKQHNVQETQLSPQQGRLGVAAMPQRPVQRGRAAAPAGQLGAGGGGY